jgi:hypothetical protein
MRAALINAAIEAFIKDEDVALARKIFALEDRLTAFFDDTFPF